MSESTYIDPSLLPALSMALPILVSCLDDETKNKISAHVDKQELDLLAATEDNQPLKKQIETLRRLLGCQKR
ncbi:hypothetical protein [Arsenophonus sp. PmNCSU2021_1]|uniref:hypothetical protein n=1 Tax=Arsenophonus sp. PmNCSU2021_1 TaxID=3118989 RepID=UPI002FF2178C